MFCVFKVVVVLFLFVCVCVCACCFCFWKVAHLNELWPWWLIIVDDGNDLSWLMLTEMMTWTSHDCRSIWGGWAVDVLQRRHVGHPLGDSRWIWAPAVEGENFISEISWNPWRRFRKTCHRYDFAAFAHTNVISDNFSICLQVFLWMCCSETKCMLCVKMQKSHHWRLTWNAAAILVKDRSSLARNSGRADSHQPMCYFFGWPHVGHATSLGRTESPRISSFRYNILLKHLHKIPPLEHRIIVRVSSQWYVRMCATHSGNVNHQCVSASHEGGCICALGSF